MRWHRASTCVFDVPTNWWQKKTHFACVMPGRVSTRLRSARSLEACNSRTPRNPLTPIVVPAVPGSTISFSLPPDGVWIAMLAQSGLQMAPVAVQGSNPASIPYVGGGGNLVASWFIPGVGLQTAFVRLQDATAATGRGLVRAGRRERLHGCRSSADERPNGRPLAVPAVAGRTVSLRHPPGARWSSLTLQNDTQSQSFPLDGDVPANVNYAGNGGSGIALWYDAGEPAADDVSVLRRRGSVPRRLILVDLEQ